MKTIAVIPARGGSKGIPRKNLRPLAGKPLIYYAIKAVKAARSVARVVVSTDDDEIALFAERFGASVIRRPEALANDAATLDPVVQHTVVTAEEKWCEVYEVVLTVQPTSPLITAADIDRIADRLIREKCDTVLTVVDDRHLTWSLKNGHPAPNYERRVNRQQLPATYKETGAIVACSRKQIESGTRIGNSVALEEMPAERSVDIDDFGDLYLCDALLRKRRIVMTVVGYAEVGLGHAYRAVTIAHELTHHDLVFLCEESSELAAEYIRKNNYSVEVCPDGELARYLAKLRPDLIINDILDTSAEYMDALKLIGAAVVNFEDLGAGSEKADLVINALYPHQIPAEHVLVGPKYFCVRDEFLFVPDKNHFPSTVKRVLVTFGGVDEGNLTTRVLDLIQAYCADNGIAIDVVVGPGFSHQDVLYSAAGDCDYINIVRNTNRISDYMIAADVAITSGGRTVLELATLEVPTIVICQNQRETTHTFASSENGVVNLGFRGFVTDSQIITAFRQVVEDAPLRETMRKKARSLDLMTGKRRVVNKILSLLDDSTGP